MNTFDNKYGISNIEIKYDLQCFCPLGLDYYTAHFVIDVDTKDTLVDFSDIVKFLNGLIRGEYIVEELVGIVFTEIKEQYCPDYLSVTATVDNAGHLPVKVTKTM